MRRDRTDTTLALDAHERFGLLLLAALLAVLGAMHWGWL